MKKGLSQAELGGIVGLGQSYISNLENKRRDPGFHAVVLMAHVLGMELPRLNGLLPASGAEPEGGMAAGQEPPQALL